MTLLALVIQTLSFYMVYNTSRRAVLRRDAFSVWLQRHTLLATIAGLLLLGISFIVFVIAQGFGAGIFIGALSLMTIGSLIVMLVPLKTNRRDAR